MHALRSFRLRVSSTGGSAFSADFRVRGDKVCTGVVTTGHVHVEIISTGDATYQKGDRSYWEQDAGKSDTHFVNEVSGRWAKSPVIAQYASLCDLDKLLGSVQPGSRDGSVHAAPDSNGQPVVELMTRPGGTEVDHILVQTVRPHRMISLSADSLTIQFSDFDVPVGVDVPKPGHFVDMAQLLAP